MSSIEIEQTTLDESLQLDYPKIASSWKKVIFICVWFSLLAIACWAVVLGAFMSEREIDGIVYVTIGAAVLYSLAVIGTLLRKSWGRMIGYGICGLMLFGFPIGTVIGWIGCLGYDGAKPLFGEDAIKYSEVKNKLNQSNT